jgi:hypothetical protein
VKVKFQQRYQKSHRPVILASLAVQSFDRAHADTIPKAKRALFSDIPSSRIFRVVGAVWTLYPSPEFVQEIIRGNEQMAEKKQLDRAESRENQALPGYGIPQAGRNRGRLSPEGNFSHPKGRGK